MFHKDGPSLWELTQQALSSTTRGYDLLAPRFEVTPFRTPDPLLETVMAEIGPPGAAQAGLDICCGTGAGLRALRPYCRDRVVGIDLSEGMLEQARRRADEAQGAARVELLQMDALQMTFDQEFDVATCFGAFGHILHPDQDRFADGVRRALKPGGRFLFITRPMPGLQESVWWKARAFNAAMHVRNLLPGPPFIMFYLTFTLERARDVLQRHGFSLTARAAWANEYKDFWLVTATKR
jgi:ubiquinone/menaquinone biosynthesis C-methylase UbiE